ncbi:MAG: tetratricopeptide repeat protein [Fibromonadaceae bacterium]|jgi:tetratricopeptide (TPR) repeat protein|nr:tetratricopeptide repeat protein [Fibromonadaceae bacterium]
MNKFTILFVLFCVITSIAQGKKQNVAVYMAGEEPAGAKGVHKVLGAELAKAITASKTYSAIDRTNEIQKQIAKEHTYQRSGMVNDTQIKALGKQLGVQYMCIAEATQVGKSFYLEVKLVDVETAKVMQVASTDADLKNAKEMVATVRKITQELLPREVVTEVDSAQYYFDRGWADMVRLLIASSGFTVKINVADWDKAVADLTRAIQLKPDAAEYYATRALGYRNGQSFNFLSNYDEAIADYTKAIQLKPDNAEYYIDRGSAYESNRKLDKTIADYESALRIDPSHAKAKEKLESVQEDLQKHKNEISEYTEKIQKEPNRTSNFSFRGSKYWWIGEFDKAIDDYTKAIQLDPNCEHVYGAYRGRGLAYAAKKDFTKAISDLETAARLNPDDTGIKRDLEKVRNYQKYSRPRGK